jgi:hypothetical protein
VSRNEAVLELSHALLSLYSQHVYDYFFATSVELRCTINSVACRDIYSLALNRKCFLTPATRKDGMTKPSWQ